jgi:hypothetical protein
MNKSTQITLDLEVDDDFLSGRIRDGSGAGRAFSGWLGLMAAIDELLAAAGGEGTPAPGTFKPQEER